MNEDPRNSKTPLDDQPLHPAEKSNMPESQLPNFRSNRNEEHGQMKSEAGHLGTEVGEGDFGAEEARADAEKGNQGSAGNMPYTVSKKKYDSKDDFPQVLQQNYPEIIGYTWKTSETLELILNPDCNADGFADVLKTGLPQDLGFKAHLDLMVKKVDDPYFAVIELNKHSSSKN